MSRGPHFGPETPTPRELAAFKSWVSHGSHTDPDRITKYSLSHRAKAKLGLDYRTHTECLAWVLLTHPEWLLEDSPIAIALADTMKFARLGKVLFSEFEHLRIRTTTPDQLFKE